MPLTEEPTGVLQVRRPACANKNRTLSLTLYLPEPESCRDSEGVEDVDVSMCWFVLSVDVSVFQRWEGFADI